MSFYWICQIIFAFRRNGPGMKRIPCESYWKDLSIKLSICHGWDWFACSCLDFSSNVSHILSVINEEQIFPFEPFCWAQSTEYTRKSIIHIPHTFIHLSARYKTLKCINTVWVWAFFWFISNIKVKEEINLLERLCLTWGRFDSSSSHNTDFLGTFHHTHNFLVIHNDPLDRNCFDADENI